MKYNLKKKTLIFLKYFFLCLLIFWPLVHMGLSLAGVINSWKFSGWGMYASTGPKKLKIKVLFLKEGENKIPPFSLAMTKENDSFILDEAKKPFSLKGIQASRRELNLLGKRSQYVRTMPTLSSLKGYIDQKRFLVERKTKLSFPHAFLFLTKRRLRPKKGLSYLETEVFFSNNHQVHFFKKFTGLQTNEKDLNTALNEYLSSVQRKGL